ncbi:multidrug efflux SMR transporter [Nocardioides sp. L-11A]|uniref:DMT family transporter n=1 Tax=Nocardioides sp. L-11A TaxID=3043848 RepID=UPI002499B59E|nr:multidrug efflux SMR transporter [Nocardioides sp. L-11A]
MTTYLLLAAAIAAEVAATMSLKKSQGFTQPVATTVVVVCYALAFFLLAQVLNRGVPVAVAYAVWSAVGIIAVAGIGAAFLGERLSGVQVAGIALIVGGVIALELGTAD